MTLEQLIARFRLDADDRVANPYLSEDQDVAAWLTEAQAEAAIRGRLLMEASNPAVCEIVVDPGVSTYDLHPALYELTHLRFKPTGAFLAQPVRLKTREELDRIDSHWRDRADGVVEWAIQDDSRLTLVAKPSAGGVLLLEGYRVPLRPLQEPDDKPEIHQAHHLHLVHWALYRHFMRPDAEFYDPKRAMAAEAEFTAYFGARPDADLRRSTRTDETQTNKAFDL